MRIDRFSFLSAETASAVLPHRKNQCPNFFPLAVEFQFEPIHMQRLQHTLHVRVARMPLRIREDIVEIELPLA